MACFVWSIRPSSFSLIVQLPQFSRLLPFRATLRHQLATQIEDGTQFWCLKSRPNRYYHLLCRIRELWDTVPCVEILR
jgi:hypothetical protein